MVSTGGGGTFGWWTLPRQPGKSVFNLSYAGQSEGEEEVVQVGGPRSRREGLDALG